MLREQQLQSAILFINQLQTDIPLSRQLGNYFKANKKMGARDRRTFSSLVHWYYRLGSALNELSAEERIAIGAFLCETQADDLLTDLITKHSTLNAQQFGVSLTDKIAIVTQAYNGFTIDEIFPFTANLSDGIERKHFVESHFVQPKVWIRLRKRYAADVLKEIATQGWTYEQIGERCLGFEPRTALDQLKSAASGYFEVQDASSQQIGTYFKAVADEHWWDCCAASGGKSLLLLDEQPLVHLTASDVRPSIIDNLQKRFKRAGIRNCKTMVIDLMAKQPPVLAMESFDGIIADVPCSGSGTWSRTPEQLSFFNESRLIDFTDKQKRILARILPYLKHGKALVYSTCSVFEAENENIVDWLVETHGLQLEIKKTIVGYSHKADSMFVARLIKP